VQAAEKGHSGFGIGVDDIDRAVAQQIGQIAVLADLDVVIPQILGVGRGRPVFVGVIVERTAAEAIEVIVAGLQRAEIGERPQMPLADQCRPIAGFFQQGRQGRMIRRQTDFPRHAAGQRLFEPDRQPVLVTPGHQGDARGGAYGRIGIGLHEADPLGRDAVDVGRGEIAPTVAGQIGIAEIIGKNEQDIRQGPGDWVRHRFNPCRYSRKQTGWRARRP
jgi:hypothetical protein